MICFYFYNFAIIPQGGIELWAHWYGEWRKLRVFKFNLSNYRLMEFSTYLMGKKWNSLAKRLEHYFLIYIYIYIYNSQFFFFLATTWQIKISGTSLIHETIIYTISPITTCYLRCGEICYINLLMITNVTIY